MKEVIKQGLDEFASKHKQVNFESNTARELIANFINDKISGTPTEESYNNESDTCCGGNCGCDTI